MTVCAVPEPALPACPHTRSLGLPPVIHPSSPLQRSGQQPWPGDSRYQNKAFILFPLLQFMSLLEENLQVGTKGHSGVLTGSLKELGACGFQGPTPTDSDSNSSGLGPNQKKRKHSSKRIYGYILRKIIGKITHDTWVHSSYLISPVCIRFMFPKWLRRSTLKMTAHDQGLGRGKKDLN